MRFLDELNQFVIDIYKALRPLPSRIFEIGVRYPGLIALLLFLMVVFDCVIASVSGRR